MPGFGEWLIILAIVLLIFGAGKLPAIGDALGRSIKNFKRAVNANDEVEVAEKPALDSKRRAELKASAREDVEEAEVVPTKARTSRET